MQQNELIRQLQERIARLESQNVAFQAEIADRRQRSPTLQKQERAAELVKVDRSGLALRLDNFSNNFFQAAGQSFTKCLLKRIAFVVEWWKTLNKSATVAQQRVAELATLTEALQAEILLRQQTEVALRTSERRFRCTFEQEQWINPILQKQRYEEPLKCAVKA